MLSKWNKLLQQAWLATSSACAGTVRSLPADVKVIVQENPFTTTLVADVGQIRCLTFEDIAEQRFKAAEARALVLPGAGRQLILLQLYRVR